VTLTNEKVFFKHYLRVVKQAICQKWAEKLKENKNFFFGKIF